MILTDKQIRCYVIVEQLSEFEIYL